VNVDVFDSVWQDVLGIVIIVVVGLVLYMRVAGVSFGELKDMVRGVFE